MHSLSPASFRSLDMFTGFLDTGNSQHIMIKHHHMMKNGIIVKALGKFLYPMRFLEGRFTFMEYKCVYKGTLHVYY